MPEPLSEQDVKELLTAIWEGGRVLVTASGRLRAPFGAYVEQLVAEHQQQTEQLAALREVLNEMCRNYCWYECPCEEDAPVEEHQPLCRKAQAVLAPQREGE